MYQQTGVELNRFLLWHGSFARGMRQPFGVSFDWSKRYNASNAYIPRVIGSSGRAKPLLGGRVSSTEGDCTQHEDIAARKGTVSSGMWHPPQPCSRHGRHASCKLFMDFHRKTLDRVSNVNV